MYLDLNCFSYASTFSSISFFVITSLSITVILTHFSVILFSFACFINKLRYLKKYGKSIIFEIIDNLFVRLAILSFSIFCFSVSTLSRFSIAILFRFSSSSSFSISRSSSSFMIFF